MIEATEIDAICDWLDRKFDGGGSAEVRAWFEARGIDFFSVARQAERYSAASLLEIAGGTPPGATLMVSFLLGFQVGIDAERRRRDAQELPS